MLTGLWCATGALVTLWWPRSAVSYRARKWESAGAAVTPLAVVPVVAVASVGVAAFIDAAFGAAALIVGALVIWLRGRQSRAQRARRETADLLAALGAITAELSVGAPPAHAFDCAAKELDVGVATDGDSEVARALHGISARVALGGTPGDGPQHTAAAPEWRRIGRAWEIAHEYGVPIKDLLDSVRADLAARSGFAARTHAGLAGPRATAAVLALLPLLGIGLGQALGANPLAVLCGGGVGGALLIVGTALAALGVWWSARITDRVAA